ncbi:hypothetical protein RCL_jg21481.t1 [Rhizophagus clarus]|uniref:Uncharacterized protein n=1 Tax=Rhizophagus clarus TaxID=94130 RepID=A0A8H3QGW7_9GLOM|nr:hypothetical protein RCL_jg21481.t1 [Rhizophagus clarus]
MIHQRCELLNNDQTIILLHKSRKFEKVIMLSSDGNLKNFVEDLEKDLELLVKTLEAIVEALHHRLQSNSCHLFKNALQL